MHNPTDNGATHQYIGSITVRLSFRRKDHAFIVNFRCNQFEEYVYTKYLLFASRSTLYPSLYQQATTLLTSFSWVQSRELWQVIRESRVKSLFHWLPLSEVDLGCVLQKNSIISIQSHCNSLLGTSNYTLLPTLVNSLIS